MIGRKVKKKYSKRKEKIVVVWSNELVKEERREEDVRWCRREKQKRNDTPNGIR